MAINLQTAFISPPVGFSLFYLQSSAPKEVTTVDIHRGAIPFVVLQVLVLLLVMAFPQTVTWLVGISNDLNQAARASGGGGLGIERVLGYSVLAGLALIALGRLLRRTRAVALS
jgi:hypothetical protein